MRKISGFLPSCKGLGMAMVFLALFSCRTSPVDLAMYKALGAAWTIVGKEYRAYVKADPNLSEDTKKTRIRTADLMTEALLESRDEL